jgi:hypothetical protein
MTKQDTLPPHVEALAHRLAWRYKKSSDPHHSDTYTFNRATLHQFAAALAAQAPQQTQGVAVRWSNAAIYSTRQRKWCEEYERTTGFEPLMCDYEAGNEGFVEAAESSVKWYEDHTNDMYLQITRKAIPGSEFDDGTSYE